MATSVLSNALLLLDDRDLSGTSNTVGIDFGAESQDKTAIANDTRIMQGGLKTVGVSAEGFFQGEVDSDLFSAVGVSGSLISVAPGTSVGDVAYTLQSVVGQYTPLQGGVGELAGFSLNASARNSLQRGSVLFKNDSVSSSGSGSTLNAGAASSQITAILHVFDQTGGSSPTLDVTIESDSSDDFTGLETTQITFTQAMGRTSERKISVGAETDTWWRVSYTIGGTSSPAFGFAVILVLE